MAIVSHASADILITFLLFIESSLTNQYEAILGLWNFQFSWEEIRKEFFWEWRWKEVEEEEEDEGDQDEKDE